MDDVEDWKMTPADRAMRVLALDLAERQTANREVHTEVLHLLIAKLMDAHPPDKPHTPHRKKQAILAAMEYYKVRKRTVREAIREAKRNSAAK